MSLSIFDLNNQSGSSVESIRVKYFEMASNFILTPLSITLTQSIGFWSIFETSHFKFQKPTKNGENQRISQRNVVKLLFEF